MKVVWTHRAIRHLVAIRNHIAKDSSIRIDAGTKRRLEALSQSVNRSKSFLAAEAITNYVEAEEWQLGEIAEGIAELDANQTVPHEKVAKWLATSGKPDETKAPR